MQRPIALFAAIVCLGALASCSDNHATDPQGSPSASGQPQVASEIALADAEEASMAWQTPASIAWNATARQLVAKNANNPIAALRVYTLVSVAQDDAAHALYRCADGCRRASRRVSIASASATVLTYLYPAEAASLEAMVAAEIAASHCDPSAGDAAGRTAGAAVVESARTDGFSAVWTGTVPVGPGLWFSSSTPPAPPFLPLWGQARPYFLTSGDQFRLPPPPAFGSAEFLTALAVVRQISDTRTREQDSLAKFWNLPPGTITPAGYWNERASDLIEQFRFNERRASHMLALMNEAGYDASIACWDTKYTYWFIRPPQADPLITTSFPMPNHPSYPSGHACVSGAETTIIGAFFPSARREFHDLADQAALSRIYGGIHYPFDGSTGLQLGRTIARFAIRQEEHSPRHFAER